MARRYPNPYSREAEGGIAKILGVLFILVGIYAVVDLYGIFSIDAITGNYVLIACAVGSVIGGLFMLGKSGKEKLRY